MGRPSGGFVAVILMMLILLPGRARGQAVDQRAGWHLTGESSWLYGPAKGRVQTPSGGDPGTTSDDRPTLSELNVEIVKMVDAEIRGGKGDHEIYFGRQWILFEEDATLDWDLLTQGRLFEAGTDVETDLMFNTWRLGYRYRIQRGDEPGIEFPVEIHSRFGVAMLDFHYQLDGPGPDADDVDRAYRKAAVQLGVELDWHVNRWFTLGGDASWTLPFTSHPLIATASVTGHFTLYEKRGSRLSAFVGAGYEKIMFEDDQEIPNELNLDLGPMMIVGLELRL